MVVSARVNDYCVFALRIYLYYGVPVFYIGCFYKRYVSPVAFKNFGKKAAVRSFTWATEAEKEHADFYSVALKALESGDTSSLPRQYWICLVCGDTFKSLEGVDACPLCGTKAEKFLVSG